MINTVEDAVPGAVIAMKTFGEFIKFNPHPHIIATDGCFNRDGDFMIGTSRMHRRAVSEANDQPRPQARDLEEHFRAEVFKMLKKAGEINDAVIENMLTWHHSGFNVYCGDPIDYSEEANLERLAQYIARAPISQERMTYTAQDESTNSAAQVIYKDKSGTISQTFDALDWVAKLITHIPNKGEQLVRYYGYYSSKSRGKRKKLEVENAEIADAGTITIEKSSLTNKAFRKKWAGRSASLHCSPKHPGQLLSKKCIRSTLLYVQSAMALCA